MGVGPKSAITIKRGGEGGVKQKYLLIARAMQKRVCIRFGGLERRLRIDEHHQEEMKAVHNIVHVIKLSKL